MTGLTVGMAARRAGVRVATLHYYERRGLLPRAPRTSGNYRMYDEEAVRRLRFIKRAQELGFTLDEIGDLLSLRASPGAGCADVRRRAEDKIRDVDAKLRTLVSMREALADLVAACSGEGPVTDCPILDTLDREAPE